MNEKMFPIVELTEKLQHFPEIVLGIFSMIAGIGVLSLIVTGFFSNR